MLKALSTFKVAALRAHKSQMKDWDPEEEIKKWAKEAANGKEMAYAEGYYVYTLVDDESWGKLSQPRTLILQGVLVPSSRLQPNYLPKMDGRIDKVVCAVKPHTPLYRNSSYFRKGSKVLH